MATVTGWWEELHAAFTLELAIDLGMNATGISIAAYPSSTLFPSEHLFPSTP